MMLKAALAAHLADSRIKLVHIWRNGKSFNAMLEWPDTKPERHVTGAGDDEATAVLRALMLLGFGGLRCRLFMLAYAVGRQVKR